MILKPVVAYVYPSQMENPWKITMTLTMDTGYRRKESTPEEILKMFRS